MYNLIQGISYPLIKAFPGIGSGRCYFGMNAGRYTQSQFAGIRFFWDSSFLFTVGKIMVNGVVEINSWKKENAKFT